MTARWRHRGRAQASLVQVVKSQIQRPASYFVAPDVCCRGWYSCGTRRHSKACRAQLTLFSRCTPVPRQRLRLRGLPHAHSRHCKTARARATARLIRQVPWYRLCAHGQFSLSVVKVFTGARQKLRAHGIVGAWRWGNCCHATFACAKSSSRLNRICPLHAENNETLAA